MSIPLRCRFGFHDWSKWSEPVKGTVKRPGHFAVDDVLCQERSCHDCGEHQARSVPV